MIDLLLQMGAWLYLSLITITWAGMIGGVLGGDSNTGDGGFILLALSMPALGLFLTKFCTVWGLIPLGVGGVIACILAYRKTIR